MTDKLKHRKARSPAFDRPTPWRWITERGLRLDTGEATLVLYRCLVDAQLDEVEAVLPADASLLVVIRPGSAPSRRLQALLGGAVPESGATVGRLHTLKVEYGGKAGPDLTRVAAAAGLTEDAAVALHSSALYRVMFIGFQPGFAYLQGTPAVLQQPRLARPRARVAASSLAIGGPYSGIYPAAGPGGWNLIGKAYADLFDPARVTPALLQPGDHVRLLAQ